jgi:hypothetical protein
LHDSIAFEKGIEWFTEIFCFYGVLTLFAIYELNSNECQRLKQIEDIENTEDSNEKKSAIILALENEV